jgi:hypothetical protein
VVAAATGIGDSDGTQAAARVWFEGKFAWGCVGEVYLSLYRDVGGVRKD